MKLINSVLVPLDISGDYMEVISAAITCCAHAGSEMVLYYAHPEQISSEKSDRLEQDLTTEAQELATSLNIDIIAVRSKVVHELIPEGRVFKQLLSDAELVVMGGGTNPENQSKKDRLIRIIDEVHQPVLVIPNKSGLNKPTRILFCSSYREMSSDDPLKILKYLAGAFSAKVRIAHVKTHGGSPKEGHIDRSRFEGKYFEPEVPYSYKLIRNRDVIDGINEYIEKKGDNDLVAMVRRKHHVIDRLFGPNFTHQMLKESRIPLLILKENQLN